MNLKIVKEILPLQFIRRIFWRLGMSLMPLNHVNSILSFCNLTTSIPLVVTSNYCYWFFIYHFYSKLYIIISSAFSRRTHLTVFLPACLSVCLRLSAWESNVYSYACPQAHRTCRTSCLLQRTREQRAEVEVSQLLAPRTPAVSTSLPTEQMFHRRLCGQIPEFAGCTDMHQHS
jgi:hypothetical protein